MVLAVFTSVFFMVLLAELADKTQLVTLALAAESSKPRQVYLGAMAGLFCVTALGALAGSLVTLLIPLELVRLGSGAAFLALGVYTIVTAGGSKEGEGASTMDENRVWLRAFLLLFVAELGDKTQLVVILSAASSGLVLVVLLAGFAALAIVNTIGVALGDRVRLLLSSRAIGYVAGAAFILTGLLLLLGLV